MPNMISLRTFRLATVSGHVINFVANQPVYVPPGAVSDAMAQGCVPENAADQPFYEDMSKARVEFHGDVRQSMIYLAIKAVVDKNSALDFDGAGVPKVEIIGGKLGFDVTRKEVEALFQMQQQAAAEGREVALHPAAANITLVLDAVTKNDLVELAEEFGVDKAHIKGLDGKALRKFLLTKFDGTAA